MSLLVRPTIVFAILFGCFAALIPRILLPFFRPRSSSPSSHPHESTRRSPLSSVALKETDDTIEPISFSPSDSPFVSPPTIQSDQSSVDSPQPVALDEAGSKSMVKFALPMYTVGIVVFFLYTCCKFWSKRSRQENKLQERYSSQNIRWHADKYKFKYEVDTRLMDDNYDAGNEEDQYAGLDSDYVKYLKSKKQKELEIQRTMTAEQTQMHYTLDDMKSSLSFISTKLATNDSRGNLSQNEISQLQDRVASTEAQMYKILNALGAASNKVQEISQNTRQSLEQSQQSLIDDNGRRSSRSHSDSEQSLNENDNSLSDDDDDDSNHPDEQVVSSNNKHEEDEEESSSSSYEDEEEMPDEIEDDSHDQSESSSDRYGIMEPNYGCDPTTVNDYELNSAEKSDPTANSRTKVQQWRQRNHSQSLSSSTSSIEPDQSLPTSPTRPKPQ